MAQASRAEHTADTFERMQRAGLITAAAVDAMEGRLHAAFAHLHDMGEIIYFENDPGCANWIVLDPQWFGGKRVLGAILAPATVRVPAMPTLLRDGVIKRNELDRVLTVSGVEAGQLEPVVALLEAMELCYPEDEGRTAFMFPARLKPTGDNEDAPLRAWHDQGHAFAAHGGRRVKCTDELDMLPPQYFPLAAAGPAGAPLSRRPVGLAHRRCPLPGANAPGSGRAQPRRPPRRLRGPRRDGQRPTAVPRAAPRARRAGHVHPRQIGCRGPAHDADARH